MRERSARIYLECADRREVRAATACFICGEQFTIADSETIDVLQACSLSKSMTRELAHRQWRRLAQLGDEIADHYYKVHEQ